MFEAKVYTTAILSLSGMMDETHTARETVSRFNQQHAASTGPISAEGTVGAHQVHRGGQVHTGRIQQRGAVRKALIHVDLSVIIKNLMIYDSRSGLADSACLGGICAADIKYRQGRIVVIVGCDHIQEAAAVLCMDKIGIQRIEHILGHAGPVSDFDLQAVISIAVLTFRYDSGYGEGFCTAIPVQISLLLYVGLQPCDIAALRGAVCAGEEIFVIMKLLAGRVQSMENDYNDAQNLLKTLRDSDSAKKQSLFSKIKKHVNHYQTNKDKVTPPSADALRDTLSTASDEAFGQIETYPKGTVIYNEGDDGDCMYILHVGKVCTYKDYGTADQVKLEDLSAISVFGEMGIVSEETRTATAVAEDNETYIEIIYQKDLEAIINLCPVKVEAILRHLSYRLRKINIDFIRTCKEITETYEQK